MKKKINEKNKLKTSENQDGERKKLLLKTITKRLLNNGSDDKTSSTPTHQTND